MSDNKDLWNRAFTTDPRAVKPITGKQYQGNSPKPYWLIERATEEFGPVGIGWGVIVKSERFERLSDDDVLHVAVVSVWFMKDGQRSETFDQMGGTKACYRTKKGDLIVDEDAGKKSVTDGMVKCLSMIGFAGDIFSGRWDDSKYVAEARQFYEEKELDEAHPVPRARRDELDELALFMIDCHQTEKDMDAIRLWYEPSTWSKVNEDEMEEKKYTWGLLKDFSKLRGAIKANKPDAQQEPQATDAS